VRRGAAGHDQLRSAIDLLTKWEPPDAEQARLRDRFLAHVEAHADALLRTCVPAHITASALVVDAARERALLTLHPKVGAWVQLGGHCEAADLDLPAAALREATEESGIANLTVASDPLDLDTPTTSPAFRAVGGPSTSTSGSS
jgi:hypothetical protein